MTVAARISPRAYAATGAAVTLAGLALVWAWVALAPMAFLDPEYPSFVAKREMLQRCDLGAVLVVGDSRAAADILPRRLQARAANLAIGGGGPIEAYFLLRRALGCGQKPEAVLLSLNAGHFVQTDTFWERSVRFGLIDAADLTDFTETAARFDDRSFDTRLGDGLPAPLRAWLYTIRFPTIYFASLLRTGGVLRYWGNRQTLAASLEARGQYFFGTDPGSDGVAMEGALRGFAARPLLDHYLDRLLTLADTASVPVRFVSMPVNEATWSATDPAVRQGFARFLAGHAARHASLTVAPDIMPHWPNRYFGDGYSHLNPAGAKLLTDRLAACLRERPGEPCDLGWTGPKPDERNS